MMTKAIDNICLFIASCFFDESHSNFEVKDTILIL